MWANPDLSRTPSVLQKLPYCCFMKGKSLHCHCSCPNILSPRPYRVTVFFCPYYICLLRQKSEDSPILLIGTLYRLNAICTLRAFFKTVCVPSNAWSSVPASGISEPLEGYTEPLCTGSDGVPSELPRVECTLLTFQLSAFTNSY